MVLEHTTHARARLIDSLTLKTKRIKDWDQSPQLQASRNEHDTPTRQTRPFPGAKFRIASANLHSDTEMRNVLVSIRGVNRA